MIGGGTVMGLSNLLTGVRDFDEIVALAAKGDHRNVDMLVKDIYGENSPGGKLSGDILASSFAKVSYNLSEQRQQEYRKEDILNSLMFMVSFNIGQLAYLVADNHEVTDLYFVGNFVRNNQPALEKIHMAV